MTHPRGEWIGIAGLLLATVAVPAEAGAQSPEERGRQVALEAVRRDEGWHDMEAELEMRIRDGSGGERTRRLRILALEGRGEGGGRTLVVVEHPADLRGTAVLTHHRPGRADDQWLYLPALRRVKRIASAARGGAFMGSDFSYEDVAAPGPDAFRHRHLRRDTLRGRPATVVERRPKDAGSAYARQFVWYDAEYYQILRVTYLDREGRSVKTLEAEGYRLHEGRWWRPARVVMSDHRTGSSTELLWTGHAFRVGLTERDFDPRTLERAR